MKFKHSVQVEAYLSGEMTFEECEVFLSEVSSDPQFSGELEFSRDIDAAISREDVIDLRRKLLVQFREQRHPKTESPVVRISRNRWWYAAASVILLAAISGLLYFMSVRTPSSDALFRQYYNAENIIDVTRSENATIVEAVIKFQEKDYAMASRLFGKILVKDPSNIAVWFYYGISCIETENYSKAKEAFSRIITDDNNLYVEHAQWYLGLAYLKNHETKNAISKMKLIAADPENFHNREARHLLADLQKR